MQTDIKSLIQIVKTGSPSEVKVAQRRVENIWHTVYVPHREEGRLVFRAFLEELNTYDRIRDVDHQAYFINTLKWPLMAFGEEYFEDWAFFFLDNIQSPSGKVRQAVISAMDYLMMDISSALRLGHNDKKALTPKQKELMVKNRIRFGTLVIMVESLIDQYRERRFNKYRYISSLPAGIYKSLNKLLSEVLLRSDYLINLYKDFLNDLRTEQKNIGPQSPSNQLYKLNIDASEFQTHLSRKLPNRPQ